jgi:hypothetical protein
VPYSVRETFGPKGINDERYTDHYHCDAH